MSWILGCKPLILRTTNDSNISKRFFKMKMWQCLVCGLVYEEELGWPEDGIAPGTRWEDVPADWTCPECGVTKAEFEMVEF